MVVQKHLVVELTRFKVGESVEHEEGEDETADEMCPYVYGLVMDHEQASGQLRVAIEIDPVPPQDVLVVQLELVRVFRVANEARLVPR